MIAVSSPVAIQALDADAVRRDEHGSGDDVALRRRGRHRIRVQHGWGPASGATHQDGHGRVDCRHQARHVVQRWPIGEGRYQTGNREDLRCKTRLPRRPRPLAGIRQPVPVGVHPALGTHRVSCQKSFSMITASPPAGWPLARTPARGVPASAPGTDVRDPQAARAPAPVHPAPARGSSACIQPGARSRSVICPKNRTFYGQIATRICVVGRLVHGGPFGPGEGEGACHRLSQLDVIACHSSMS